MGENERMRMNGMNRLSPMLLLLVIALSARTTHGTSTRKQTFGKPLQAGTVSVPLAELTSHPESYSGKAVRTEGPVAAVCSQKGCWMTLGAGDRSVRVTFEGYSFFVPKNAAGSIATLEGVFKAEKIPEATAKHYAGETPGGKPDAIKGDQKELSIVATGVELVRAAKK